MADPGSGGSGGGLWARPRRARRRGRPLAWGALGRTSFDTVTSVATKEPWVALTGDDRDASRATMIAALDALLRRQAGRFRFVTVPDPWATGTPRRKMWLEQPEQPRERGEPA